MSDHSHNAPPNPYLEPRRTQDETRALQERVAKLEQALTEKGIVTRESLDHIADLYENDIGPMNGARVVARAWTDPAYKQRLLEHGTAAITELGYTGLQGEHIVVVENKENGVNRQHAAYTKVNSHITQHNDRITA